jgi:hypothetical protein
MLLLIAANKDHGPDESDMRYNQLRDMMAEHMRNSTPGSSAVFQHLLSSMLRERSEELESVEGASLEVRLWTLLETWLAHKPKGSRTTCAQFMRVPRTLRELLSVWWSTVFSVTVPALELDMVTKNALPKVALRCSGADDAAVASTSAKTVSVGDRTLRTCGVNAVVITMGAMSNPCHHRLASIVEGTARPTTHWQGHGNKECRSGPSSQKWFLDQLGGDLCKHVHETLTVDLSLDFLDRCGFLAQQAPHYHIDML